MWSPSTQSIHYDTKRIQHPNGKVALLHEIGHARLNHRFYKYDMELLRMEMDAWDIARGLAPQFGLEIDEEHIAQAIASYDEWLSKRATCPDCDNFCLQKDRSKFSCFACGSTWKVNERKDRRVKRTITSRFEPIHAFQRVAH
jgi:hypothetical protein